MGKKFYLALALALIPLLLLTACGDRGTTTSTTAQTTTQLTTTLPITTTTTSTTPTTTQTTMTSTTTTTTTPPTTTTTSGTQDISLTETPPHMTVTFKLTSTSFTDGGEIPYKYGWNGGNKSPQFSWSGYPDGTISFVFIMEDMDTLVPPDRITNFCHWLLYDIPAHITELAEGQLLSDQIVEGMDDYGFIGYGGPWPPAGETHHYRFRLYALDTMLNIDSGLMKLEVLTMMEGHILGFVDYFGTFQG
jgi:Raf kinase inhibitor-like YbhB/YbcL family protein